MADFELLAPGGHQKLVDEVVDRLDLKADIDGYYAQLIAGAADNLTGEATDSAAWLQRVSTADGPTTIRSIHGRTLRWNQLISSRGNVGVNTSYATRGYADGVLTATVTNPNTNAYIAAYDVLSTERVGHKLLFRADFKVTSSASGVAMHLLGPNTGSAIAVTSGAWTHVAAIATPSSYSSASFYVYYDTSVALSAGDTVQMQNHGIYDLTAMFGAGSEPSTIEEFTALYPLPYYEYDAGSLLPVNMEGIETVGFNQWDEEWRLGSYNTSGAFVTGYNFIANVNPIRVLPNTAYCCTAGIWRWEYDADGAYLGVSAQTSANGTFTTGANTGFICFRTSAQATAYNHDICVNISDPTRNGEYEPYWQQERSVPAGILRGAGPVYDELTETGRITRVGEVDLGTLTWNKGDALTDGTGSVFYTYSRNLTVPGSFSGAKLARYSRNGAAASSWEVLSKGEYYDGTTTLVIGGDSSLTAAQFKESVSGILMHYALATPTTTPIDPPLNLTYRTEQGGTERVMVPTGEQSAPPTLVTTQGYTAESLRDAALAAIAPVENGTASTNYGVGSYLVHAGQLCKVTTAIATGESITIGTNVTTTTVMAEVIALIAQ